MSPEKSFDRNSSLSLDAKYTVASRYLSEERVGWGFYAEVFRGRDTQTGKTVAIKRAKIILGNDFPDANEVLRDEGQILRDLSHPNIVQILDIIEEDQRVFLILEYLEGGSLRSVIDRDQQLTIERTMEISLDLADALTRAHRLNIVHSDLKPGNIVFTADGKPKIADFALSYGPLVQPLLERGDLIGSLPYLSPEMLDGSPASIRSNIWSFGVLMREMLTGYVPFSGDTVDTLRESILNKPLPDFERIRPDSPPSLSRLIEEMLETDPEKRLPSMRLVSAEVEAILLGSHYILPDRPVDTIRQMEQVKPHEIVDGRFLRQGKLAEGGHSDVYLGFDEETGQRIAIKRLKPQLIVKNPELVTRFLQEGEVLMQLDHPNIVKVLATIVFEGDYLIVMEYIPGGNLDDLLAFRKRLSISQALSIGLELADALTRTHHLGIVHRDLKPSNVLIAEDNSPRLTDFGLARIIHDDVRLTRTGTIMGSPLYMSPEACKGETVGKPADIWSLGAILYEMVAGQPPFVGDQITEILIKILTNPVPDINEFRTDVPYDLKVLLNQMLVKSPEKRLTSVREVAAKLDHIRSTL
jgi:serine/threonine protein kinase